MNNAAARVLIVDDMPVNRMILSSLLASRGVVSDQADGGLMCLDMVRAKDYELILLDHRMPEMDGVDTLVQLKEIFREKGQTVPVICHTAEEGRKNINLYKAAGFADVLIKPFDPEQLSEIILNYLPEISDPTASNEPFQGSLVSDPHAGLKDEEIKDELDKLPLWLKIVPHIDLDAGIKSCGSAEDYIDALYIFRSSIEEKSDEIEIYVGNSDWTMFRLAVHSLKSMARLVGARTLGNIAADMESRADNKDYNGIKDRIDELLIEYRRFIKPLDPLTEDEDGIRDR